ncbi:MAG: TonB-dependent receptor [Bacteroidales bacterium]|nr:TonB-dependent receptor [Candidatus Cryptobacteroides caccocaballi]
MTRNCLAKVASVVLACAMSVLGFAQNRAISGTVVDAQGPIMGATVMVVGNSSIGTVTDIDGKFAMQVPANSTIVVDCLGYTSQTISVGNQTTFNVVLVEDSEFLEETVVIGYGVQKKSDLTGSVASIREDALKNQSTTDAAQALQGKVSGVHILSNAAPGSGANIRVRGFSSNSDKIAPLLIVDGLQVSSIQYLDPSMIESIEVLKDAASAAIYGAEAGNGVILVTTKTGSDGKTSVSYTGKATLQTVNRRIMMGRDELLQYLAYENGQAWVDDYVGKFDYSHPMYKDGVIDQDWMDAYTEPTWSQQHSISFTGGNKAGHFFTSLNYVKDNGIVKGDKDVYTRLTAQVNADYQIFKWLQVGTTNSIEKWSTQSVSQRGYSTSFESMLLMDPLTPVYWTTVNEMSSDVKTMYERVQSGDPKVRPYRFFSDENGWFANTKYSDAEGSALAKRDATDSQNGGFNINGTLFANLTPIKGLTITSRLGYRISQSTSHSYTAPYYIGPRGSQDNYSISATANTGYYYQWENFANYMRTFGKHGITAMVGMSYRENNSDNVTASSSGADILSSYESNFQFISYVKGSASKTISNAPSRSASLAYFGRLIYTYDNRYSVQANFRADAFDSSKLPITKPWGYFPSVSAGWTISNEPFWKNNVNNHIFNFLKLRASWGRNGNISVLSGYKYASTISLGNNWYQYSVDNMGSTYASAPSGIPNANLTWETSEQLDFGLDARFFDNRLTLGFDYFDKRTKDLLFDVPQTPELGVSSMTQNGGNVLNRGVELELSWRDTIGDFSYGISANFSSLHNEVLSLPAGTPPSEKGDASSSNYQVKTVFEAGYPVWYLKGYRYLGVNEKGEGIIDDISGDGKIDASDMTYIGSGTPTATFGLNINLAWKGLDLTIFGSGVAGNVIMPCLHRTGFKNHMKVYKELYENGTYPNPSWTVGNYQFWSSDANVFKGDYFRIKQIQLGYTLPQNITKKAKISDLRFYLSLDDFITFSKYPGLDPETAALNTTSGNGLDWGSYPTMQKLVLGVNLTF